MVALCIPALNYDVRYLRMARITTEKRVSYEKTSLHKYPKKILVRKIKEYMGTYKIKENDMKIFNKILGDHKLLDKIQLCTDGSYVNGRIYYMPITVDFNFHIDGVFWYHHPIMHSEFGDMQYTDIIRKQLDFMKNNFETIYLQFV